MAEPEPAVLNQSKAAVINPAKNYMKFMASIILYEK